MDTSIDQTVGVMDSLPDWLSAAPVSPPPRTAYQARAQTELVQTQFECMFLRVLEDMASGKTLNQVLTDDFRGFKSGAFLRWVKRDPERHTLYKEAKEIRTEYWAGEIITISDGEGSLEDVQRSTLRVNSRKWLMGSDNRKVYGETKTIDVGGSISIISALEAANSRVVDLIDVEDVQPRLENY